MWLSKLLPKQGLVDFFGLLIQPVAHCLWCWEPQLCSLSSLPFLCSASSASPPSLLYTPGAWLPMTDVLLSRAHLKLRHLVELKTSRRLVWDAAVRPHPPLLRAPAPSELSGESSGFAAGWHGFPSTCPQCCMACSERSASSLCFRASQQSFSKLL